MNAESSGVSEGAFKLIRDFHASLDEPGIKLLQERIRAWAKDRADRLDEKLKWMEESRRHAKKLRKRAEGYRKWFEEYKRRLEEDPRKVGPESWKPDPWLDFKGSPPRRGWVWGTFGTGAESWEGWGPAELEQTREPKHDLLPGPDEVIDLDTACAYVSALCDRFIRTDAKVSPWRWTRGPVPVLSVNPQGTVCSEKAAGEPPPQKDLEEERLCSRYRALTNSLNMPGAVLPDQETEDCIRRVKQYLSTTRAGDTGRAETVAQGKPRETSAEGAKLPPPPATQERCAPMTLEELARRFMNKKRVRADKIKPILKQYDLRRTAPGKNLWTIRVDNIDDRALRERMTRPAEK